MMRLPSLDTGRRFYTCCGKVICSGCAYAPVYDDKGNRIRERTCPFCRTPMPTPVEEIKRYEKRMELNDSRAIFNLGCYYAGGRYGLPQNAAKASELWHRAAELGSADAYYNIGSTCMAGDGMERDKKKAVHYWELSAMRGNVEARHNLGSFEANAGNYDKALKHWMIAVRDGDPDALESIKKMYEREYATKDDYATALRYYQAYLDMIKSDQRDNAAAFYDKKYY